MRKIIGILILVLLLTALFVVWQVLGPQVSNPDKEFLYIPTGATYTQLKDSLLKNEMIEGEFWFDKVADYAKLPKNVKPGKYKIEDGESIYHLVRKLRSGIQEPVDLVITKVRTKADLAARIAKKLEMDSLQVMKFLNNPEALKQYNVDKQTVLTVVLPNTYRYYWTADMHDIFEKLYKNYQKFWNEERRAKAAKLQLSPKEVYILASIVEEETNKQSDKGKIASVYINRLRRGMNLGADPTVKYALGNFGLTRIYHKHLDVVSPYNTYRNPGLPPGPICTPSIKTIEAVLNAPETDYLFFVAKPDFSGYSNFAVSYSEHQKYARAYQNALDSLEEQRKNQN